MSPPFDWTQGLKSIYSFSRSSFLDLPQEIILMILLHAAVEKGEISCHERTRVQLICKTLSDFVNHVPYFWNHLSVWEPKVLWQKHLDKSGQLELAVTCDCSPNWELYASFLSTILPHAHRIRSFTCRVNQKSGEVAVEVTTHAAPILRDLRLFSANELTLIDLGPIPFHDMPRLETMDIEALDLNETMWYEATDLRVVKLKNVDWVEEVWRFLDFLEENDQLESFHYHMTENVFSPDDLLGPPTLPDSYDTIALPNLTHVTLYSIPASHLLVILQHVSFPPHSHISATIPDCFPPDSEQTPPEQPAVDFLVPVLNRLVALRPPSSLAMLFNSEEAYVTAAEQRWNLGFFNEPLNYEPREEAYRTLLQLIPPEIRALIYSVNAVDIWTDEAKFLVEALSDDVTPLITIECRLDDEWLAALWEDESRGWDGFRLPRLHSIAFNVCKRSTAANIRALRDLLQARSAAVQGAMHGLDTRIIVPMQYDEGEIQAALEDPSLLNLGPRIERVEMNEAESNGAFEEDEEELNTDDEENVETDDLDDGGPIL
ncbi:hypothetical protein M407DRAFT_28896 [Tulasnella calospora MUT 4182]|uniref:F-box domain-containing protein n=1 Tax=Tulasnella calospora MUT 4182 TaxID=1051891 RepID=A0A0C3QB51_9AGAM|nr:hypothetical protein M407DRAFT_28896 [Tulasnella calospora MUT 4182]